jgi:DNA modification methylase
MELETVTIESLALDPNNARKHSKRNLDAITSSLKKFGQRKPIVVHHGTVLAGNGTLEAAKSLGWTEISITRCPDDWDADTAKAYALADNRSAELAEWDDLTLAAQLIDLENKEWDIADLGFDAEFKKIEDELQRMINPSLADRFLIPPFSIFDARAGYWQNRKRHWISIGIKSEEGRDQNLLGFNDRDTEMGKRIGGLGNVSIFDPVLCEIAYRWFTAPGSTVLDPFAGGSVRGVVAAYLEHHYTGLELSAEQVQTNQNQAAKILTDQKGTAKWIIGDSNVSLDKLPDDYKADFILSCPPYADLEVYSDDPADISNMPYNKFLEIYRSIIAKAVDRLKDDRFAVWVITEVRDKKTGIYKSFVPDTIKAFQDAGMEYYNEAILINAVGSLPVRAGRYFTSSRKLGRLHQNVLIFVKGDFKKATEFCGDVEIVLEDEQSN